MEQVRILTFDPVHPLEFSAGDLLLGLGCCGVHADQFPLDLEALGVDEGLLSLRIPELNCTVGEELKKPVRVYGKALASLELRGLKPKAVARITGGFCGSISSMMPSGLTARIETDSFPVPSSFELIAQRANLSRQEMFEHFNMGIGLVLVVSRLLVGQVKNILCCCGERAYIIGSVIRGVSGYELI